MSLARVACSPSHTLSTPLGRASVATPAGAYAARHMPRQTQGAVGCDQGMLGWLAGWRVGQQMCGAVGTTACSYMRCSRAACSACLTGEQLDQCCDCAVRFVPSCSTIQLIKHDARTPAGACSTQDKFSEHECTQALPLSPQHICLTRHAICVGTAARSSFVAL